MKNNELSKRIKALRSRKGFSQEELSERTGLSLRTVQRIENGETEPRGDSLKRLAEAFSVSPDEIVDWTVQDDKGLLTSLNLSALSFILFPLLGIIVPLIIWISRKDKVNNVNELAKEILNFEITWCMVLFVGFMGIAAYTASRINVQGDVSPSMITSQLFIYSIFWAAMYAYNGILIFVNTAKISNNKKASYYPKIRFVR